MAESTLTHSEGNNTVQSHYYKDFKILKNFCSNTLLISRNG